MAIVEVMEVARMPVAASEKDEAIQARLGNPLLGVLHAHYVSISSILVPTNFQLSVYI